MWLSTAAGQHTIFAWIWIAVNSQLMKSMMNTKQLIFLLSGHCKLDKFNVRKMNQNIPWF